MTTLANGVVLDKILTHPGEGYGMTVAVAQRVFMGKGKIATCHCTENHKDCGK